MCGIEEKRENSIYRLHTQGWNVLSHAWPSHISAVSNQPPINDISAELLSYMCVHISTFLFLTQFFGFLFVLGDGLTTRVIREYRSNDNICSYYTLGERQWDPQQSPRSPTEKKEMRGLEHLHFQILTQLKGPTYCETYTLTHLLSLYLQKSQFIIIRIFVQFLEMKTSQSVQFRKHFALHRTFTNTRLSSLYIY